MLLVAMLGVGCNARHDREHQVYDALFAQADQQIMFVAAATDGRWFVENDLATLIAEERDRPADTEPSWLKPGYAELLQELYRVNASSQPLNWRPRGRRFEMLPGSYASKPTPGSETRDKCLAPSSEATIGVAFDRAGRRAFRPYHSVSRVAFSPDGTLAMLKYAYFCAPMSGAGESLEVFRLESGKWVVDGGRRFWVS